MLDIFWSASSQQANLYAWGGTNEEAVTNQIVDIAIRHAARHGYTNARNDPGQEYWQHRDKSNALKPRYHICVHTNAGGGKGPTMYCFRPAEPGRLSTKLATNIHERILEISLGPDRGIKAGTFDEIVKVDAAVAYPEVDFHDDAERARWLIENKSEIAEQLVKGILDTDGKAWIPEITVELPAPDWKGQLQERDEKITFLTNEIAAGQKRIGELTLALEQARNEAASANARADEANGDLRTLAAIIKKHEV